MWDSTSETQDEWHGGGVLGAGEEVVGGVWGVLIHITFRDSASKQINK